MNGAHVDMLLTKMILGIIVTASSADGNIYIRRLCRCAAFIDYFDEGACVYVLMKKVLRRECVNICDYLQIATH